MIGGNLSYILSTYNIEIRAFGRYNSLELRRLNKRALFVDDAFIAADVAFIRELYGWCGSTVHTLIF
jgi:hypothetical protein